VLGLAAPGATVLLNAPCAPTEVWGRLPLEVQEVVLEKRLKLFSIDAVKVAREAGLGGRVNAVMQTCFFAISGVLPREEAIARIKESIQKSYGKKGDEVVRRNFQAVDRTLENLHRVEVPPAAACPRCRRTRPTSSSG
jgi:pyruvate-ferredoxin/flavodoxin oxidoreductase